MREPFPMIVLAEQPDNVAVCQACDQFSTLECGRGSCAKFGSPERFYAAVRESACPLGKHKQEESGGAV